MASSTIKGLSSALTKDILLVSIPAPPPHPDWAADIETRYPGLQVRWSPPTNPAAGRYGVLDDLPPEAWDGVTLLMCFRPPPAHRLTNVRYVQLTSAGADRWLQHDKFKDENVVFCTASGTHAPQIAEWVIGTWLMFQHRFLQCADFMKTGSWARGKVTGIQDSSGLRIGVLGYGAIGRQCARLASALGMKVYAYTRSERPTTEARKDDSFCVTGTGDPDGTLPAKWFHGADQGSVNHFLAQDLDLLVISVPLTASTAAMIGVEQFDIMSKRKTFVANIARGKIIDTAALLEALEQGKIRGAALDVTDPEPLPEDHPLWKAPNVFITPHISWMTPYYWERCVRILEINLERISQGQPLINVINKKENY